MRAGGEARDTSGARRSKRGQGGARSTQVAKRSVIGHGEADVGLAGRGETDAGKAKGSKVYAVRCSSRGEGRCGGARLRSSKGGENEKSKRGNKEKFRTCHTTGSVRLWASVAGSESLIAYNVSPLPVDQSPHTSSVPSRLVCYQ
jgi:hypothetical protein